MKFDQAVSMAFGRYAEFGGRSSRSEFWYFTLFAMVIEYGATFLDVRMGTQFGPNGEFGIIGLIVGLGLLLPRLAVAIRRLHDTDHSGWWLILAPVALVFFFFDGTPGENR